MANYPQELAQDTVCQSHTGHMTGLWFLPTRPLRLNTNEWLKPQVAWNLLSVSIYENRNCLEILVEILHSDLNKIWSHRTCFVTEKYGWELELLQSFWWPSRWISTKFLKRCVGYNERSLMSPCTFGIIIYNKADNRNFLANFMEIYLIKFEQNIWNW